MLKNKLLILSFLFFFSGITIFSFNYPLKNIFITSIFGESRGDHFHSGIDFARAKKIYSINSGEVLFYADKKNPLIPHWGIGNFMVIEHANQLRSHYYHLKNDSIITGLTSVKSNQEIAEMGNSGRSSGNHLHLTIYDYKNKKILNPYDLLPPVEDNTKPKINALLFKINKKIYKIKNNSQLFYTGPLEIFVIAGDYRNPKIPLVGNNVTGIKSLALKVDGELLRKYEFNYLKEKEGKNLIDNQYSINEVYGLAHNYKLGTFQIDRTSYTFEIIAKDKNDNLTSLKRKVKFRFKR